MQHRHLLAAFGMALGVVPTSLAAAPQHALRVYFGTYTRSGESRGIYQGRLDLRSGELTVEGVAAETTNPSFLAIHPNRRYLYSVGEIASFGGQRTGAVTAFRIAAESGKLEQINQQESGGPGPCHVVVDATGRTLLVANYAGGSVKAMPILDDGSLGPGGTVIQHEGSSVHPQRQSGPHAHSVNLAPSNRFAYVPDLGLDKILVYQLEPATATLIPADPASVALPPGSGPRHFAFHPSGQFAFAINELASTITAFRYHAANGQLTSLGTVSTLPADFSGENTTAEIQVHPSGRFVYGSNRGHNSIAAFRFDADAGSLALIEHESTQGRTPRNFAVDPSGRFLLAANQDSGNVVVFRIDERDGSLAPTGGAVNVPSPVCIKFLAGP